MRKKKHKAAIIETPLAVAIRDADLNFAELAKLARTTRQTVQRLAKDRRTLSKAWAERFAPHVKKSAAELMFGSEQVNVIGKVGAGAKVYPFDDLAQGAYLEQIERPEGIAGIVVGLIVTGDSMFPRYKDGEYLLHSDKQPPSALVGRECVVWLTDGSILVKDLHGGANGLYTLVSHNAPPIENAAVEAAAPVLARVNRGGR